MFVVPTLFFFLHFPLTCVGVGVFWNLVSDLVDIAPICTLKSRCHVMSTVLYISHPILHISVSYFGQVFSTGWIVMNF